MLDLIIVHNNRLVNTFVGLGVRVQTKALLHSATVFLFYCPTLQTNPSSNMGNQLNGHTNWLFVQCWIHLVFPLFTLLCYACRQEQYSYNNVPDS